MNTETNTRVQLGDILKIVAVVDRAKRKIVTQYVPTPRGTSKSKARDMKAENTAELEKIITNEKFKEKTKSQQRLAVVGKDSTFLVYSDSKTSDLCYCVIGGRNLIHQDTFKMIHEFANVYASYKDVKLPSKKLQQDIKLLVGKYMPPDTSSSLASQNSSRNNGSSVGVEDRKGVPCFCCC